MQQLRGKVVQRGHVVERKEQRHVKMVLPAATSLRDYSEGYCEDNIEINFRPASQGRFDCMATLSGSIGNRQTLKVKVKVKVKVEVEEEMLSQRDTSELKGRDRYEHIVREAGD